MSRIILGSAQIGEVDQKTADELLSTAFDAGLAGVDTAPSYGDSEVRIGRWIRKTNQRIRIYSKVGTPEVYGLDEKLTPSKIQTSVDDSLARLGVETLDTLFLHSTASSEFNESNLEALLKLKKSGKILSIGYSGDGSNLAVASEISNFETLMMSINCLDQTNLVVAKKAQELGSVVRQESIKPTSI
jgi:aryl-alcohol dehydrogenase-like predicted oxidoreductase